jgi:hypothetical protein
MRATEEYRGSFEMPSNRARDQSCGLFLMHVVFLEGRRSSRLFTLTVSRGQSRCLNCASATKRGPARRPAATVFPSLPAEFGKFIAEETVASCMRRNVQLASFFDHQPESRGGSMLLKTSAAKAEYATIESRGPPVSIQRCVNDVRPAHRTPAKPVPDAYSRLAWSREKRRSRWPL